MTTKVKTKSPKTESAITKLTDAIDVIKKSQDDLEALENQIVEAESTMNNLEASLDEATKAAETHTDLVKRRSLLAPRADHICQSARARISGLVNDAQREVLAETKAKYAGDVAEANAAITKAAENLERAIVLRREVLNKMGLHARNMMPTGAGLGLNIPVCTTGDAGRAREAAILYELRNDVPFITQQQQ